MEPVVLGVIVDSAIRIVIRLALGEFLLMGPHKNILEVESRVAWATVVTELEKEGYAMVPPGEYGAEYALDPDAVSTMIERDGSLFALVCKTVGKTLLAVPLAEREGHGGLGPIPA